MCKHISGQDTISNKKARDFLGLLSQHFNFIVQYK